MSACEANKAEEPIPGRPENSDMGSSCNLVSKFPSDKGVLASARVADWVAAALRASALSSAYCCCSLCSVAPASAAATAAPMAVVLSEDANVAGGAVVEVDHTADVVAVVVHGLAGVDDTCLELPPPATSATAMAAGVTGVIEAPLSVDSALTLRVGVGLMDACRTVLVGMSPVTTTATAGSSSALFTESRADASLVGELSAAGVVAVSAVLPSARGCRGGSCDCCLVSTSTFSALIKGMFSAAVSATGVALLMYSIAGSVRDPGAGVCILFCEPAVMAIAVALTSPALSRRTGSSPSPPFAADLDLLAATGAGFGAASCAGVTETGTGDVNGSGTAVTTSVFLVCVENEATAGLGLSGESEPIICRVQVYTSKYYYDNTNFEPNLARFVRGNKYWI